MTTLKDARVGQIVSFPYMYDGSWRVVTKGPEAAGLCSTAPRGFTTDRIHVELTREVQLERSAK